MPFNRLRKSLALSALCSTLAITSLVVNIDARARELPSSRQSSTDQTGVQFDMDLQLVTDGFRLPVFLTHANDGTNRMFVVEKTGRIAIIQEGKRLDQYFLDISALVNARGNEQGLLGLAFHPNYQTNGYFFVYYTNNDSDQVVARYQVSQDDPDVADLGSAKLVLMMDDRYANHNGGMLAFGPDGYLWIGTGDGGGGGDPLRSGQNTKTLLGKLLRINVNELPYTIPADNPFADGKDGLPEVWAYGLRNPWRFSFDRVTGDLYIGDVGQNQYEEINFVKAGTKGGLNFGWNVMEGFHCYQGSCDPSQYVPPIFEYDHSMGISVTGGYVYRGSSFPRMQGAYFFGDFGTTTIWATRETSPGVFDTDVVLRANVPISSFGEDAAGELYVLDYGNGAVYRIIDKG